MIIIALIGFDKSGGLIQEGIIELLRKNFAQVAILEMEEPVEINPEVLLVGTSFHEKDASAIRSSLLLDSLKVLPAKEDFFEEKHGTLNLERRNSFKRALKFKAPPRRHWHRKL